MSVESYYHLQMTKATPEVAQAFETAKTRLHRNIDHVDSDTQKDGICATTGRMHRAYLDDEATYKILQVPHGENLILAVSFEDDAIAFVRGGEIPKYVRPRNITALPNAASRLTDLTMGEDFLTSEEIELLFSETEWELVDAPTEKAVGAQA